MKEVKYHAGNKVNTMNGNDEKDNLIRCKTTCSGVISTLFSTLQNRTEWDGTGMEEDGMEQDGIEYNRMGGTEHAEQKKMD